MTANVQNEPWGIAFNHPTRAAKNWLTMLVPLKHISHMNHLSAKARSQVISCLIEGCSIRSTVRMTGVAKKTVMHLLVEAGFVAAEYQANVFRDLPCERIQVDERWAFVGAKQKNLTPQNIERGAVGDIWLWSAVDADSKLVPTWLLGDRNASTAQMFMLDLAGRLSNRVQLTSDGHGAYLRAVEGAFGHDVDYVQLQKLYGETAESEKGYSPAKCSGRKLHKLIGDLEPKHINTSFVERHNLSLRMTNSRYTRLTNAFSKKIENHAAAVALGYFAHNFIKIHRTLRVTPAMAAGVTDRLWDVSDLIVLIEAKKRRVKRAA